MPKMFSLVPSFSLSLTHTHNETETDTGCGSCFQPQGERIIHFKHVDNISVPNGGQYMHKKNFSITL